MPLAIEQFKIPANVDLVFSDSSAFAKGIIAPKNIPHICYLHTPTRYLWQDRQSYLEEAPIPFFIKPFLPYILNTFKRWDYLAATRPDFYICNSENVKNRLNRYYDRESSEVVFPYVDTDKFRPTKSLKNYFLILGRIEPYKRFDLACEAAKRANVQL